MLELLDIKNKNELKTTYAVQSTTGRTKRGHHYRSNYSKTANYFGSWRRNRVWNLHQFIQDIFHGSMATPGSDNQRNHIGICLS